MIRRFLLIAALGFMVLGLVLVFGLSPGEEEPVELPTDGPVGTVFVGDSITAGYSPQMTSPDDTHSWVTYAVADDRSPWDRHAVVAQAGRTLGQMAAVFEGQVLSRDPGAVVIMGGTNDVALGQPVEESVAALRSMVTGAQDRGVTVWIVSPPPLDPAHGDLPTLVDAQADLADELDVAFVDVREELSGADGTWEDGLSFDGVHPSEEGARRLAVAVLDAVVDQ